ncbi:MULTISPECIES: response regulator transcription factor [Streptomyces]|uniref:response regulator transcription factor n=1 Tax=Streptomyces TaxID=1883 RepID=UPI001582CEB4|nr:MULTISPECIES: response regulator transcription factor [Streptomyces]
MTTVLVVHEVALWRQALRCLLLHADHPLRVLSCGREEVRHAASAERPEVYVLDLDCPGSLSLLEEVGTVRREDPESGHLVVLGRGDRPGALRTAATAGARGYVDKYGGTEELPTVVRKVAEGGRYIDESLAFGLLQAAEIPLSGRELAVLSLAAQGDSVACIARRLNLTNGTVRNYLAAAVRKSGGRNRSHAIRLAHESGWI